MFENSLIFVAIATAIILLLNLIFLSQSFKKAKQGQALVRSGMGGIKVSFNGMMVIPIFHRLDIVDMSVQKLSLERKGAKSLTTKDEIRVNLRATFVMRVNPRLEDIKKVIQTIGAERAANPETLMELFEAQFSGAFELMARQFTYEELIGYTDEFKHKVTEFIESEEPLLGYTLETVAIDQIEKVDDSKIE